MAHIMVRARWVRQTQHRPLAAGVSPREFTIAELRRIYEAIWGEELDPRNFSRKALSRGHG
jgi:8-oxo-dGTP diphosphatase